MTGYFLLFGLPIVHPSVKAAYGKSVIGFWIVMLVGAVCLVVDIYTNYVIFYAIASMFTQSELIRFIVGITGSILMGLADVFLFGAVRCLNRRDTMIIYMILGVMYLTDVALYDISFTHRALGYWMPSEIGLMISIFTTVAEIFFFQALEDLRMVRMAWKVNANPKLDIEPKFWGRRIFGQDVRTVYRTMEEFRYYFWGGIVSFFYRFGTILVTFIGFGADKAREYWFALLLLALFCSTIVTFSDFFLTRFLERSFRKELSTVYMWAGITVSAGMSLLALYCGAMPLINGGFEPLLAIGISGSASALLVLYLQTIIDWAEAGRAPVLKRF